MNYTGRHMKSTGIILEDLLKKYDGKIVRIGTDGSGYFICAKWDKRALKDLEYLEQWRLNQKKASIDKMESEIPTIRKLLPNLKKQLEQKEKELNDLPKTKEEIVAEIAHRAHVRSMRRIRLPQMIMDYLDRQRQANEELIGNLSGRAKAGARRTFEAYARNRKKKWDARVKKYTEYLKRADAADVELMNQIKNNEKIADDMNMQIQVLKKRISTNTAKLQTYPSKIRAGRKYIEKYTPMMKRDVMEVYPGINKNETSIIVRGGEMGSFWDCDEFNKWRKFGVFPGSESDGGEG